MRNFLDYVGKWPLPGPEARKNKRILIIKPNERLNLIHGIKHQVPISFGVSNDFIHLFIMEIPEGNISDLEKHAGDEILYVLQGELSVVIPDNEENKSVARSRFEVKEGQRFLVPENTSHFYFNTSERHCKIVVGIAPAL